jgi:hypothetical protein
VLIPVGELERWVQRPGADARRRAGAADPAAQLAFAA